MMNRKDVEKFLELVKDQAFGIWLRHNNDENDSWQFEVSEEVELLDESLIIAEQTINEDKTIDKYWCIINLADIVQMNSNY